MEHIAHEIVKDYIIDHLDKSDDIPQFEVYTVWKCKALQNWKFLISSTLLDGMYYELTFNGDENEWYLDAYKKFENRTIGWPDRKTEPQTDCKGENCVWWSWSKKYCARMLRDMPCEYKPRYFEDEPQTDGRRE